MAVATSSSVGFVVTVTTISRTRRGSAYGRTHFVHDVKLCNALRSSSSVGYRSANPPPYPWTMKDYHRRVEPTMSDEQRTRLMVEMRRRGYSYARIGRALCMSANGVMQAIRRVTEPHRYYQRLDEEVDDPVPPEDDW